MDSALLDPADFTGWGEPLGPWPSTLVGVEGVIFLDDGSLECGEGVVGFAFGGVDPGSGLSVAEAHGSRLYCSEFGEEGFAFFAFGVKAKQVGTAGADWVAGCGCFDDVGFWGRWGFFVVWVSTSEYEVGCHGIF
jgi:hypothetical protein